MDSFKSIALGFSIGICIGWILKGKLFMKMTVPSVAAVGGTNKMILVVRSDLKMGKGKIAAQCSHAAVDAYCIAKKMNPVLLKTWARYGQAKVVLKVDSEAHLMKVAKEATLLGLPVSIIADAGRTQIAAGSKTVVGIGPACEKLINEVTGELKLL